MSHYRAYLIASGHHIEAVDFDCVGDDDGREVELWEHARRIARFDSKLE